MAGAEFPEEPLDRLRLATALFQQRSRAEAVDLCRQLIFEKPDLGAAWGEVANLCWELGDDSAAVAACKFHVENDPTDASRITIMAEYLSSTDQPDAALELVEAVLKQEPYLPSGQFRAGFYCAQLGEFERALHYFRKAFALEPTLPLCWRHYSRLKQFKRNDPDLEKLKRIVEENRHLPPQDRLELLYAMAKATGDAGNYDEAFRYYAEGAALVRDTEPAQVDTYVEYYERLKQTFSAEELERFRIEGAGSDRPIFIVGLPRTGTTLVEQILASHSDVTGGGEHGCLRLATQQLMDLEAGEIEGFLDRISTAATVVEDAWAAMGNNYLRLITERFGPDGRITDRNPGNHILIGVLGLILPQAKIIYCTRDPADTAWSCYKTRFEKGHLWSYGFDDIARYMPAFGSLMDHWRTVCPDAIHEVRYENLIEDLAGETERMLAFCGLEPDPACQRFHQTQRVVTSPAMAQVRRPVYPDSIGAWKKFEKHIGPMVGALGGEQASTDGEDS